MKRANIMTRCLEQTISKTAGLQSVPGRSSGQYLPEVIQGWTTSDEELLAKKKLLLAMIERCQETQHISLLCIGLHSYRPVGRS